MTDELHTPPHDLEAERSVLGACLLENAVIDDVALIVEAESFYRIAHQKMWEAVIELYHAGEAVDVVTLASRLGEDIEDIGGLSYLVTVLETVPHAAHAQFYARIVRQKHSLRQVIDTAGRMIRDAQDQSLEPLEVIAKADNAVRDLLEGVSGDHTQELGELLIEALEDDGEERLIVETGFARLDRLTGGMTAGNLIVLGARPAVGKTAFAAMVSLQVSLQEQGVLLVSLEQTNREIADRLLSMRSGVDSYAMRKGDLEPEDHSALVQAGNELHHIPLHVWDPTDVTVGRIGSMARVMSRRKHGLKLLVIDYLQLIREDDPREHRERQVARMSRGLKLLAKDLQIPVVVLAQMNRESTKADGSARRPRMSELRESGAVEQDADQVWLLWRPGRSDDRSDSEREAVAAPPPSPEKHVELVVAKNRSGRIGNVDLQFTPSCLRFREDDGWTENEDPHAYASTTPATQQELL